MKKATLAAFLLLLLVPVWCRAQWVIAPTSPYHSSYQIMSNLQITADGTIWANILRPYGMGAFNSDVYTSTDVPDLAAKPHWRRQCQYGGRAYRVGYPRT